MQKVRSNNLTIRSTITPETVDFLHYPDGDEQLHIHIRQDISGRSIFLTKEHAIEIRDFLNRYYPKA